MAVKKIKKSVEIAPTTETLPSETVQEVQEAVKEVVTLQPIVQPIVYENADIKPIAWQLGGLDWKEEITPAEQFAVEKVAKPLEAKGVQSYLYQIYDENAPRPENYVVIVPDGTINSTDFANDEVIARESFIQFIVQGKGKTFANHVLEISLYIVELLEAEWRTQGKVYKINNDDFGYDTEKDLTTRTVSCYFKY